MLQCFPEREITETNKMGFKCEGTKRLIQCACKTHCAIMDWYLLAPLEPQVICDAWTGKTPCLGHG